MIRKYLRLIRGLLWPYKFKRYLEYAEGFNDDKFKYMIQTGRIAEIQYRMYMMFSMNSNGRAWLKAKTHELFMMPCPIDKDLLLYLEGQRSIFKEISNAIDYVENELKNTQEEDYARSNKQPN